MIPCDDDHFVERILEMEGHPTFVCSTCEKIVPAYSLGTGWKPYLKGMCKECSRKYMIAKQERYPNDPFWMHVIEDTALIRRMEEESEAMRNGTWKCPDCGIPCKTPLCNDCHKKLLIRLEAESNEQLRKLRVFEGRQ